MCAYSCKYKLPSKDDYGMPSANTFFDSTTQGHKPNVSPNNNYLVGKFYGYTDSYPITDNEGGEITVNGKPVEVPPIKWVFSIQENNTILLEQENLETGLKVTYTGTFKSNTDGKGETEFDCTFRENSSSKYPAQPEYRLAIEIGTRTGICHEIYNNGQPDFVISDKQESIEDFARCIKLDKQITILEAREMVEKRVCRFGSVLGQRSISSNGLKSYLFLCEMASDNGYCMFQISMSGKVIKSECGRSEIINLYKKYKLE